MSSCIADWLATLEERLWSLVLRCQFCLRTSVSWAVTESNRAVMGTMPETVAERIERMEPSPAVMDWRAWVVRSWTRSGSSWRPFLDSAKISDRKARGGEGREEGDGEGGSWRQGVLAWEMAAANA